MRRSVPFKKICRVAGKWHRADRMCISVQNKGSTVVIPFRRSDFGYINGEHRKGEWILSNTSGRWIFNTLRGHTRSYCDRYAILCGSHGDARRGVRSPIAGETLKGTRGIRLAAYVLGSKARTRGFPTLVKQSGDKPVCRGALVRAISRYF